MFTLSLCIIFMVIGYALGRVETDKKWIERQPVQTPRCSAPAEANMMTMIMGDGKEYKFNLDQTVNENMMPSSVIEKLRRGAL